MKTIHRLLIMLLSVTPIATHAQRNEILNDRIATLQVVAGDDWLSPPVTFLQGKPIHISFDDLTHEYHRYTYKIQHCEADWSVSDGLFESDYIDGFTDGNLIEDTEESLNTNMLYTHYRLTIPNKNCRLKMSGNYRLTVYDDNNDEEPMLSACFMVVEPRMSVSMTISPNTDIDVNKSHQQVSMALNYNGVHVTDPTSQLHTVVMQNGRWDNAILNARPQYTMNDGLRWEHCRALIFDAGNEYHKFEVLDTDHPTLGIDRIRWDGERFHAFVFTNEPRPNYLYDEDANGAFYIRNSDNIENDRLTDYVMVHFQLMCPSPVEGDVYLNGVWTNDQFLPEYQMEYDEVSKSYQAAILLKMGYYSYQYLLVDNDGYTHVMPTEGNFFQTENKYQALVYYREPGGRTDLLVGYQQVQTKY
jgi:hypothetical protein